MRCNFFEFFNELWRDINEIENAAYQHKKTIVPLLNPPSRE
jgi:hypothetical protein